MSTKRGKMSAELWATGVVGQALRLPLSVAEVLAPPRQRSLAVWLLITAQCTLLIAQSAFAQSTNGISLAISGLAAPSGLTLGPEKNLFISDSAAGAVYRVGVNGTVALEASGFASPRDVVFDGAGNMYVADAAKGTVYRLDTEGRTIILAANLLSPCCLGFDANGNLLVSHQIPSNSRGSDIPVATGPEFTGAITRIAPDGQQTLVASGFLNPQGVLVDRNANILVAAEGYLDSRGSPDTVVGATGSGIFKIDELGQITRILDVGSITPSGLALSPQGTLFFSGTPNTFGVSGSVFLTDSGTFSSFVTGLQQPRGLAADSNALYVADEAAGEVWRVSLKAATGRAEHASGTDAATTGVGAAVSAAKRKSDGSSQNASGSSNAVTSSTSVTTALGGVKPLSGCQNNPPDKPDPPTGRYGGEPVNLASGVFHLERTDLVIPGLMPIVFKHIYRTENAGQAGRMGIGGSDNYDYRIRYVSSTQLLFALPTNDRFSFVKQADGSYINTDTYWLAGARLYDSGIDGEARYTLRFKDGTGFLFGRGSYSYCLTYIVDPNGNQLQLVTSGGDLREIRQPSGRTLSVTTVNGNIAQITDSAGRTVSYAYDGGNRLTNVVNALGGVTSYTYTGNNLHTITLPNQVQFLENIYDANSRVVTQILADAGTFSFSYATDPSGVVTQTVMLNPLGNAATYNFSANSFNTSIVDALGNTTTFIRNPNDGVVTQIIDPLSRTTGFAYDDSRNVLAITNAQNRVTKFTYEPDFNRLTSVVDPLSHTNSFGYDGQGNLTSITNALGKITRISYSAFGLPSSVIDPLGNTYTFTYNETLDLAGVTDPLGDEVKRMVDGAGRPYALIDPFGRVVRITYDALDRITQITDPLSGSVSFGYDPAGGLTNITDSLGHTVSYGYDAMARRTNRVDQLSRVETYRYDTNGNVTNFVDRRGVSVGLLYDALDRRTGVVYGAGNNVGFLYDAVGRVTNVIDSLSGNMKFGYDVMNRVTQVIDVNGTNTYGYNDLAYRTNMTVTGETPVSYMYDAANVLTNVSQGTLTASLYHDDRGRRTKLVLPTGLNVLYSYDAASRLTNITYLAAVTNRINYSYDATGHRTTRSSSLVAYNLPNAVTNSFYDAANQQVVFGSYNVLYDSNGNVTNISNNTATNSLAWNARNQLTNVTGAASASFLYDGLGRRITRTVSGATEKYLYDGLDIILQKDNGGTVQGRYFRKPGVDEPWQRTDVGAANTNRIYLADALGGTVALADTNGAIQTGYSYEPFGATTTTGASNKNSYRFTGREDDGTGLCYYRARYYNPSNGRFNQMDTVAGNNFDPQSLHKYAYCPNADPVNGRDPSGEAVYFVERRLGIGGGLPLFDLLNIGHGYLLFTAPSDPGNLDPFTSGQGIISSFSWHPYIWDYTYEENRPPFPPGVPGRVWESHPDDTMPNLRGFPEIPFIVTTDPARQTAFYAHINNWIQNMPVGYDRGDPHEVQDQYGHRNTIGVLAHTEAPKDGIYYSLFEQNCLWWATIMLKQSGIPVSAALYAEIASYNQGGGAAGDVIAGRRSASVAHRLPSPRFPVITDCVDVNSFTAVGF